jgi:hypothetical protein
MINRSELSKETVDDLIAYCHNFIPEGLLSEIALVMYYVAKFSNPDFNSARVMMRMSKTLDKMSGGEG